MVAGMARRAVVLGVFIVLLAALPAGVERARAQMITPPVANAGGPYAGVVGVPIRFSGAASTGTGLTFMWNFGDGTTATGVSPVHAFAAAVVYTVTLTVRDVAGQQSIATTTASISAASPVIVGSTMPVCFVRFGVIRCSTFTPTFTPVCVRFVFVNQFGVFQPFCVVRVPSTIFVLTVPRRIVLVPIQIGCPFGCSIFVRP